MKTITVNYRSKQKVYQYSSIDKDLEVNIRYKRKQEDFCIGTCNGQPFTFIWLEYSNGDKFLENYTVDLDTGEAITPDYETHLIEVCSIFFETF
tara:strand:+ start:289 stop:570 length:282 start_codon:yes stop_codon:yes gene_type:complete